MFGGWLPPGAISDPKTLPPLTPKATKPEVQPGLRNPVWILSGGSSLEIELDFPFIPSNITQETETRSNSHKVWFARQSLAWAIDCPGSVWTYNPGWLIANGFKPTLGELMKEIVVLRIPGFEKSHLRINVVNQYNFVLERRTKRS